MTLGVLSAHAAHDARRGDVVVAKGIHKHFASPLGRLDVLSGLDLSVQRGEVVSIVGPSGCGKTTLLRILQGLERPSAGSVAIDGQDPTKADIGFVFQQPRLFPWWTVRRNIEFGLKLSARAKHTDAADRAARVVELVELVGLGGFEEFLPSEISGGMQQRVNLARALAIDPAVLLLDEPFSAVDAMTKERLQLLLDASLSALGTTAILVTHDIREAVFLGSRVVVMSGRPGQIVDVVDVACPGPRGEEFQLSEELDALARRIHADLRDATV
jgi:ABC-type nitrate/sulfonate/bicarbonate transport system ATPase subunit